MSRQLLKEYIKKAVREKIEQQKRVEAKKEQSVYLIYKFPGLKQVFVDLMSPAFPRFIKAVEITAPKPTTFKITLLNDMDFIIYYSNKKTFIVKVSGKKYFMDELNDVERASQSVTNLLQLNYNQEELSAKKSGEESDKAAELKSAIDGGGGGGSSSPFGNSAGIDPDAPADATIPGTEPGEGEKTGAEGEPETGEEEENPEEPKP